MTLYSVAPRIITTLAALFSFIAAACAELPDSSWVEHPGATARAMQALLLDTRRDAAEGIWAATADGTEVALVRGYARGSGRTMADSYLMVILDSPHPAIMPGTVMGVATPLAAPGHYDAWIFTSRHGAKLHSPKRFTLQLADLSHITLREVRSGLKVSFSLRIPYLNRFRIQRYDNRPDNLDGLVRLWPRNEGKPQKIRRL